GLTVPPGTDDDRLAGRSRGAGPRRGAGPAGGLRPGGRPGGEQLLVGRRSGAGRGVDAAAEAARRPLPGARGLPGPAAQLRRAGDRRDADRGRIRRLSELDRGSNSAAVTAAGTACALLIRTGSSVPAR